MSKSAEDEKAKVYNPVWSKKKGTVQLITSLFDAKCGKFYTMKAEDNDDFFRCILPKVVKYVFGVNKNDLPSTVEMTAAVFTFLKNTYEKLHVTEGLDAQVAASDKHTHRRWSFYMTPEALQTSGLSIAAADTYLKNTRLWAANALLAAYKKRELSLTFDEAETLMSMVYKDPLALKYMLPDQEFSQIREVLMQRVFTNMLKWARYPDSTTRESRLLTCAWLDGAPEKDTSEFFRDPMSSEAFKAWDVKGVLKRQLEPEVLRTFEDSTKQMALKLSPEKLTHDEKEAVISLLLSGYKDFEKEDPDKGYPPQLLRLVMKPAAQFVLDKSGTYKEDLCNVVEEALPLLGSVPEEDMKKMKKVCETARGKPFSSLASTLLNQLPSVKNAGKMVALLTVNAVEHANLRGNAAGFLETRLQSTNHVLDAESHRVTNMTSPSEDVLY